MATATPSHGALSHAGRRVNRRRHRVHDLDAVETLHILEIFKGRRPCLKLGLLFPGAAHGGVDTTAAAVLDSAEDQDVKESKAESHDEDEPNQPDAIIVVVVVNFHILVNRIVDVRAREPRAVHVVNDNAEIVHAVEARQWQVRIRVELHHRGEVHGAVLAGQIAHITVKVPSTVVGSRAERDVALRRVPVAAGISAGAALRHRQRVNVVHIWTYLSQPVASSVASCGTDGHSHAKPRRLKPCWPASESATAPSTRPRCPPYPRHQGKEAFP
mmetsp:Transcript_6287/g.17605  ORF Transcript_6287/g.17605 Transcript_6287/m.17605 type:complete len:272 (+) Transcript_6287:235-1050(+)